MASTSAPQAARPATDTARMPRRRRWIGSLLPRLALVALYSANGRDLGTYATAPTTMMLLTIARGEGVYLDRFRPILHDKKRVLPVFVAAWRGHILSRYPVAPAILVQPLVVPQVVF